MKTKSQNFSEHFLLPGKRFVLKQFLFIVLAGILVASLSCKDEETPDPNVIFKAVINGASEVPVNASTATGTATLTYNTDTKIFSIVVNYSGVTATNAHIHKAAVGVSGGVAFGFTPITSPINFTSAALDSTQQADLNAHLYYVNIHSAQYPGGEIRGQLIKQ